MSSSSLVKNILLIILFIVLMYFVFQSFDKKDETLNDINNITASIEDNVNIKDMQNSKVDIEILKEGEGEVSKNGDNFKFSEWKGSRSTKAGEYISQLSLYFEMAYKKRLFWEAFTAIRHAVERSGVII